MSDEINEITEEHSDYKPADARDENGELLPDEVRLTKFGRALRSTSLDELPELWNIFKGDMSIVGPRPLLVKYLPRYNEEQHHRHDVMPGLTGWAQVNGRDTVDIYDKVYYDREYVQNVSLKFDLKVIWKSVLVVLGRKGVVDGKVDPEFRKESIVLLRESQLVQNRQVECTDENKLPMM